MFGFVLLFVVERACEERFSWARVFARPERADRVAGKWPTHDKPPSQRCKHNRNTHTRARIRYLLKNEVNVCCVRCSLSHRHRHSFAFIRSLGTKAASSLHSGLVFVNKFRTNSVAFWIACASHQVFDDLRSSFFCGGSSFQFQNFLREIILPFFCVYTDTVWCRSASIYPITSIFTVQNEERKKQRDIKRFSLRSSVEFDDLRRKKSVKKIEKLKKKKQIFRGERDRKEKKIHRFFPPGTALKIRLHFIQVEIYVVCTPRRLWVNSVCEREL